MLKVPLTAHFQGCQGQETPKMRLKSTFTERTKQILHIICWAEFSELFSLPIHTPNTFLRAGLVFDKPDLLGSIVHGTF